MTFSERLVELRKSRNLTQKQVYTSIGISMLGYQRYEYGEREPSYHNLLALANYFDVPLDYLTGQRIYKDWDKILAHWDILIDNASQIPAAFGEVLHWMIENKIDKIRIWEFISLLIEDIIFDGEEINVFWKF